MKLLLENWRKFLVEQHTDWTAITEDDLYDLDYDELIEMRDEIENPKRSSPYSRPNLRSLHPGRRFLPTINARIEAIEESEAEAEAEAEVAEAARIEDIYSGEFAMKLAKAYMGSASMGIELAAMVPDAEGLAEEFKKLRGLVQDVLGHAERSDMAPWTKWDWNKHPNTIISSVGALINQLVDLPAENRRDMNDLVDERKEILSMYYRWLESIRDLENYTFYRLHGRQPRGTVQQKLADSYSFIKDWVGED